MHSGYLSSYPLRAKGFIKGQLEQSTEGQIVLRTNQGVFPVKLEGEAPLGKEVVFRLLREEPGLVVLSPYRLESLTEALPFFNDLFTGEEALGQELFKAAVQEGLPLTREIFLNLKKGLITVESQWGVQIHPRTLAFLEARAIPLTPRTLLWALYTLFPAVQKVMWQQTTDMPEIIPYLEKEVEGKQQQAGQNNLVAARKDGPLEEVFREAVIFLRHQARRDPTLPHVIFYHFPTPQKEVRWTGRGFTAQEQVDDGKMTVDRKDSSYAFCIDYQSPYFGKIQIIGVNNKAGLKLTVVAEKPFLNQNIVDGLHSYLVQKGWPVRSVQFAEHQEGDTEGFYPLRIDGWL